MDAGRAIDEEVSGSNPDVGSTQVTGRTERVIEPTENLAALFRIDDAQLARHEAVYGSDPTARLRSLAEALSSSRPWNRLRRTARIAIRPSVGLVGVVGTVRQRDRALLGAVETAVRERVARMLPLTWPEIAAACHELADQIRTELSEEELRRCRILPVPRGGLIVAGLLAYALDLDRERVGADEQDGPTIVVDDCALSGTRLAGWLAEHRGNEVIVAVLHALPALADAMARNEPRIRRWLTARPLVDHATDRADYETWRRNWAQRFPSDPWIGEPDHVVYPWNEPDVRIWNSDTERGVRGWHVVPPSWCVKNRATARPQDVHLCRDGPGPIRPADGVLWVPLEPETIVIARLGDPAVVALRGHAAQAWEAIVATGDMSRAIESIRDRAAPRLEGVALERLLDQVVQRGYLATP